MRASGTTVVFCVLLGVAFATLDAEGAETGPQSGHDVMPVAETNLVQKGIFQRPVDLGHARGPRTPSRGDRIGPLARRDGGISCVPYARGVTGMAIFGNGRDWWDNAAGTYDRGQRPEPGSVMAFRASGSMTRGHVAVVGRVLGPRQVLIDHANWGGPGIRKGSIMHSVSVIDASPDNDWTAVRVQSGHDGAAYGRVYPLYGFIYNRRDGDARPTYARTRPVQRAPRFEQVAEMPSGPAMPTIQQPDAERLTRTAPLRHR